MLSAVPLGQSLLWGERDADSAPQGALHESLKKIIISGVGAIGFQARMV